VVELPLERKAPVNRSKGDQALVTAETALPSFIPEGPVDIIERAHPDLGRLGVFWHTQGSGKSYSIAFFAEKVRRKVPGKFTFLLAVSADRVGSYFVLMRQ
jgi:type I restriction enzyme, R subunit